MHQFDRSSGRARLARIAPPFAMAILVVALCLVAAGCGTDGGIVEVPFHIDTLAVDFQDGVSPDASYAGTRDAILKDGPTGSFRDWNFGSVPCDTIGVVQLGYDLYERRLIVLMDLSWITGCSRVLRATLSIHVEPQPDSLTLEAYQVLRPAGNSWVEGIGGPAAGVSWTTVDGGEPWTTPGGTVDPTPLDLETIADDSVFTFSLPPALVLVWIKQPSTNHGVIIASGDITTARFTTVFLRESTVARLRPRMEVVYTTGG
jgi:hypothetical protein